MKVNSVAMDIFGLAANTEQDTTYTSKVSIPQYEPRGICPSIYEIYDDRKYRELVAEIDRSNVSEDEKAFLRFAATRHIVFNYSRIADYYANTSKEMQELMERSALVIIDINDAIANGYAKLSKNVENIIRTTGDVASSPSYTEEDFRNGNPYANEQ